MSSTMRPFVAALAASVALVVWGMLFWAVLYQPAGVFRDTPPDEAVARALEASGTQTGTYFHPWPRDTEASRAEFIEGHKRGGFFKLSYVREGVDPQSPGKLALGTLHYYVVSLLAAFVVVLASPALTTFARRAGIVVLAGCIGTVFIQVGDPIWFHLPWDYVLGNLIYELVSWLILGCVLAAMLRPRA